MAVALTALVVATSGTAIAASQMNGDAIIKKHSLSGNRLRNHTITGTQVNVSKLGKVPSAANADHATSATTAVTAAAATNAVNAANATDLAGQPASAYEPSSHFIRSGIVTAASGASAPLATFGPFNLKLMCVAGTSGAVEGQIQATSTVANSDGYGTQMPTAGTGYQVLSTFGSGTTPSENDDNAADFFAPPNTAYIADLTVGQNYPGFGGSGTCFANALVSPS